tara:strand:+ start:149 stop:322 length:174 start_codon:yes stop_codon:yes gene_type:complete
MDLATPLQTKKAFEVAEEWCKENDSIVPSEIKFSAKLIIAEFYLNEKGITMIPEKKG